MKPLQNKEKFLKLIEDKQSFVIFKHSTACSRSAAVKKQVESFLAENPVNPYPFYEILVIEERDLSNFIAEKLNIRHESPQIFWLENGSLKWHEYHANIKKESLTQKLLINN